ncbi:MAG: helix-turn-helix domain-containing protein [Promethearchaeota archaeon]
MSAIQKAIDFLESTEVKMDSIVIIKGEDSIVYSSGDSDIIDELNKILKTWKFRDTREITIKGKKYSFLQITDEGFIAYSFNIGRKKTSPAGSIIGYKDKERAIISKLSPDSRTSFAFAEISRALSLMSNREPYKKADIQFGKDIGKSIAPAKVLFNTTKILQKMGLQKFGLTIDEAKVYLALLERGNNGEKVGNLYKVLDIKRPTIYAILDRLVEREWVDVEQPASLFELKKGSKKPSIFYARPMMDLIDKTIQDKEAELRVLKGFKHILKEKIKNGWEGEINYETLGITGINKDCGLVLFEFDRNIEHKENMIRAVLELFNLKIRARLDKEFDKSSGDIPKEKEKGLNLSKKLEIQRDYVSYTNLKDLDDFIVHYQKIEGYLGSVISIKFKKGSKAANNLGDIWVVLLKNVAIPVQEKIYLIWGSEEKFPTLMEIMLGFKES